MSSTFQSRIISNGPKGEGVARFCSRLPVRWKLPGTVCTPAIALVLTLCLAARANAAEHPVPLDKNFEPAKCVECHEEKSKGKAVHSAMSMGCTACHEVKTEKEVTNISLTAPTPRALCLTCHADKDAATAKGLVHAPVAKDCVTCHSPHSSANKNQLLKPTSGDKADSLCLTCHDKGVKVPEKGSRHAALDMGCDTCHVTHKTGAAGKKEFDFHLDKAPPALCVTCHEVKDATLIKTHQGQPFAAADCTSCHDPHQSNSPKLMQANLHPPFAEKACDTCHQPAKDGKVVLTQSESKAICATCHDDQAKKIETAKVPHAGAAGDCTACHTPHASRTPRLLKSAQGQVCASCHEKSAEPVRHGPYDKGQCSRCHDPHGAELPKLTRVEPAKLCAGCHVEQLELKPDEKTHTVVLPWKQVLTEKEYAASTKIGLDPGNSSGHPVARHPISGKNTKGTGEITCMTCHQPHSSALPKLMPADVKNGLEVCAKCHKEAF